MCEKGRTGKDYGMEAVCMLEDVLMFAEMVNARRLYLDLSGTH